MTESKNLFSLKYHKQKESSFCHKGRELWALPYPTAKQPPRMDIYLPLPKSTQTTRVLFLICSSNLSLWPSMLGSRPLPQCEKSVFDTPTGLKEKGQFHRCLNVSSQPDQSSVLPQAPEETFVSWDEQLDCRISWCPTFLYVSMPLIMYLPK